MDPEVINRGNLYFLYKPNRSEGSIGCKYNSRSEFGSFCRVIGHELVMTNQTMACFLHNTSLDLMFLQKEHSVAVVINGFYFAVDFN